MLECLSRSLNIQLTRGHTCDLRENLIGSHRRKKGNLEHVVELFRSLRTSLCRVTEYIVCYAPLKGPSSVRPTSQSTRTLTTS